MNLKHWTAFFLVVLFSLFTPSSLAADKYSSVADIPTPEGYDRVPVPAGTFAASLRDLELSDRKELLAGDGVTVLCDDEKVAVTEIEPFANKHDVGVDGIVRLWGDYLWNTGGRSQISFPLDNGQIATWKDWRDGLRPSAKGGRFIFMQTNTPDGSHGSYQNFLSFVAEEMGAISLRRESRTIFDDSVTVGDLLVALKKDSESSVGIILDACKGPFGERLFLLGTCGTPSTSLYIMRPYSPVQGLGDWFALEGAQYAIGHGSRTDLRRVTLK